ncbi:hypothetical protein ACFYU9_05700 [Streptomyces sp. NPDC004327]|uniref:hypothetical protein n=1 Tax=Streptomyces sp. NPDC004327 TaxID=3364699 RepID=UPI00369652E8
MGGMQDKEQKPGKGREEQQRPVRPGQDPVHPEPSRRESGANPERERRREEDLRERGVSDEDI